MLRDEFERLVAEEFPRAIPERFRAKLKNIALIVEDEPSEELRRLEGLRPGETLLGHYHGIPASERGDFYGVGPTLPDRITLFQSPIEEEAGGEERDIRRVVRETLWHEVAHYLGMDEHEVRFREDERDSKRGGGGSS